MPDARPVCIDCGKPGRWLCIVCFGRRTTKLDEAKARVLKTAEQAE